MQKKFWQLIETLKKLGVEEMLIKEVVEHIHQHKIDVICWNDDDKERIILHAFFLARAKYFLQDFLTTQSQERKIIEKYLQEIDEHVANHQWPAQVAEDDPLLLKQMWRQKNSEIHRVRQSPDHVAQAAHILALKSESNRILRILLKLPVITSAYGQYEPVLTRDLVAAMQKQHNEFVKSIIEEELQGRYPDAYNFLTALYGHRNIAKLNQLIHLKKISSQGFLKSMVQSKDALIILIENLAIARLALGENNFIKIIGSWSALDQLRLIAVLGIYHAGARFAQYDLNYDLEYSDMHIPAWMQDSTAGELKNQAHGDIGCYALVFDSSVNFSPDNQVKKELYDHYINIQENLIKPNYDALQLIVAHADKMTKMTAQTILLLLSRMVEAYRKIATPVEGDLVFNQYNLISHALEESWRELSEKDELSADLKSKITTLKDSPLSAIDSVHSLIRFLHEFGNQALEKKMISAQADITITIGYIESDQCKKIQLAKLDNAPIIVNGLIRHRAISAIIRANQRMPLPTLGAFVVINHHITYSVKLGEHRAEFSANIEHPDHEGFVRLQSYQGGIEIEQQLRGAFVEKVLKEKGMMVKCAQEGLIDSLVSGVLDKDHGARTHQQIEDAVVLVLRLIASLRDLDYAMAYIFSRDFLPKGISDKVDADKIKKFATSFAEIFLVEGKIPLDYTGGGMPLATYCEYQGPKVLQEFKAYQSSEQRMLRHRLYFTINALLRSVDFPIIPSGRGGVGQEVIDYYFNRPVRLALGRKELIINDQGFIEKNLNYHPVREIIKDILIHENEALRMAVFLNKTDLDLDFSIIGSLDQLTLMRAQKELFPNEWLVVYGLADEENRAIFYAFAQYLTPQEESAWLSVNGLRKILRKSAYFAPGKIRVPGFQKVVSHRLLVGQPSEWISIIGSSVRGLSASVGDGSARIGRITFDRNYYADPKTRDRRILLVQFTTPEDIEAIRSAEAVLVTSGGLLSHTGVTTREFAIPALIMPHAEWVQSAAGVVVRLEERHPGQMQKTAEGFWVSDSMISEIVEVHEGDMVLVWASQGIVSIMSMGKHHLEQVHGLIQRIISGENAAIDLERQLASVLLSISMQSNWEQIAVDMVSLILAETLWDRRVHPEARKKLIDIVQRVCAGMLIDGKSIRLPEKSITCINTMMQQLTGNALTELEELLSEIEHNLFKIDVLWRAQIIVSVAERHWAQVITLIKSLDLSNSRLRLIEERMNKLRNHPRIALLRATLLHEVESLSSAHLMEYHLPLIRQTLRRLGHQKNSAKPPKVLLVCTANVDRSPMAEFLLKKILSDEKISGVQVISRGVAATENVRMSEVAQALILSKDGIHGQTHRSARVTDRDIEESDLVLAMESFHVDWLKEKYPAAMGKIFLLSHYANVPELGSIKDPAGQLGDAYEQLRRELLICLKGAFKRMREEGFLSKAMIENLQIKADELASVKRHRIAQSCRVVTPLEEVDADFIELVGGKGANLGEIAQIVKRHGGMVPAALMVTTYAFQRFLEENDLLDTYQELIVAIDQVLATEGMSHQNQYGKIADLLDKIRRLILRGRLESNAGVGGEIIQALSDYGLSDAQLSVRSSGLQEDAEEASFAGAAETYLYVDPVDLLEFIKKVWTSFWLIRGILYRHDRVIQQTMTRPAVIVQKMFNSQVSGVIFTTDPVSDRDVMVIEAGYGLGEGVVSGLVDVDRYYVNKFDGSVMNFHIGKKAFKVVQHRSGKGTCIEAVDNDWRDAPCLNEENINIEIAMALEEHYALSQDIEFGIDHGKVSILQTRPVTTRGSVD